MATARALVTILFSITMMNLDFALAIILKTKREVDSLLRKMQNGEEQDE